MRLYECVLPSPSIPYHVRQFPSFLYYYIFHFSSFFSNFKKRTGTLSVNVQFIPWLPCDKGAITSQIPSKNLDSNSRLQGNLDSNSRLQGNLDLDFTKHRDGISQATARDLEMKFRRLPSGASPGVLDWAELTSSLMGRLRTKGKKLVKKSLKNQMRKALEDEKEKEVEEKEEKEKEEEQSRRYEEEKEVEERHHRLASGIIEGRHLSQICCLDNAQTDTQASIWADFTNKQVRLPSEGLSKSYLHCTPLKS